MYSSFRKPDFKKRVCYITFTSCQKSDVTIWMYAKFDLFNQFTNNLGDYSNCIFMVSMLNYYNLPRFKITLKFF